MMHVAHETPVQSSFQAYQSSVGWGRSASGSRTHPPSLPLPADALPDRFTVRQHQIFRPSVRPIHFTYACDLFGLSALEKRLDIGVGVECGAVFGVARMCCVECCATVRPA